MQEHIVPGQEQVSDSGIQCPLEAFSCKDLSHGRPAHVKFPMCTCTEDTRWTTVTCKSNFVSQCGCISNPIFKCVDILNINKNNLLNCMIFLSQKSYVGLTMINVAEFCRICFGVQIIVHSFYAKLIIMVLNGWYLLSIKIISLINSFLKITL